MIVGEHVTRDIHEIAQGERTGIITPREPSAMGTGKLDKAGFQNGPAPFRNVFHTHAVAVIAHHVEALRGGSHGRAQPQMRETGETYDRGAHRFASSMAACPRRRNKLLSQRSLERSALAPFRQREQKWAYSSCQVGSSSARVTVS